MSSKKCGKQENKFKLTDSSYCLLKQLLFASRNKLNPLIMIENKIAHAGTIKRLKKLSDSCEIKLKVNWHRTICYVYG